MLSFRKPKPEPTALETVLENAISELAGHDPDSDEYAKILKQIETIHGMTTSDKKKPSIDPNTALVVAGNLVGVIAVISYERLHVIGSKAVGLLLKPKA